MQRGPEGLAWWLWLLAYCAFAAFGGTLGYIMRSLDNKLAISWWRALFEALCAAFAGVLVVLMCQAMNVGTQWTGVIVGVCGWLGGAAAMRLLERVVSRKIGADTNVQDQ